MANDWLPDRGQDDETDFDEALSIDGGAHEETRYALTPLGVATLARDGAFAGFGPCAASAGPSPEPALGSGERRLAHARRASSTPLFG